MISSGMLISELIAELEKLQKRYGDLEVFSGGGDYPDGVNGAAYVPKSKGDGYIPGNCVKIW